MISPAKKMNTDCDSLLWRDLPEFLPKTEKILDILRNMPADDLQKLWKCSDSIAKLNVRRLQDMDLYTHLTPAVLAYEGIQYQYMAPGVFSHGEYDYIQEHLRILSGFYGILKPFDGVTPYRLEMQAKLAVGEHPDLYRFWGDSLAQKLLEETDCIINLASREYSLAVSAYLPAHISFITCVFGEEKEGRIQEKGTMCKMARGEMVRYMAEHQIRDPEKIKSFDRLDYRFAETHSGPDRFVFLRK